MRDWFIASVGAALGAYFLFVYLSHPQPSFNEAAAFIRSVHAFAEARRQHGQPLPASVPCRELVDSGYITTKVARRFDGSDVTFPRRAAGEPLALERAADEVLIRVRLRDGREVAMTAAGSIHMNPAPK